MRVSERRPVRGAIQISWEAPSGEIKRVRATCVDVSDEGVRVTCEQPIALRTNCYLQAPAFGLMGNATVRFCRRSGLKHTIGFMFSWAPSQADAGRKRLAGNLPDGSEPHDC
ncbi:MAG TPA: hypothetical protein VMT86_09660 [Bryobacteraceae bacterium]|nr:hypothetical protein [Bryobacteraceae bacterium]